MRADAARKIIPSIIFAGILGVAVFYPLVILLSNAFVTDTGINASAFVTLCESPVFLSIVWTSVRIAVIATALTILVGGFLGIVLGFMPFHGSALITRTINLYLSMPSFLIVLAFIYLWSSNGVVNGVFSSFTGRQLPFNLLSSQWGIILAELIFYTPFIVEPVLASIEKYDWHELEIAHLLGADRIRTLFTIVLPQLAPAFMAGGSLVLMHTLNEFGIVIFTGTKNVITLPTLVYSQAIGVGDMTTAAAIALVNSVLSIGLYTFSRTMLRRLESGEQ